MLKIVVAAAAAVGLSACATITRGTTQEFVVQTTPPGAAVKTTSGFTCPATPCTFKMPRKDAFTVTVTKEGFETQYAEVASNMGGGGTAGMVGNVLLGGLIGVGVDSTSGALNDLTPNPLVMTLKPSASSNPIPATSPAPTAPVASSAAPAGNPGS